MSFSPFFRTFRFLLLLPLQAVLYELGIVQHLDEARRHNFQHSRTFKTSSEHLQTAKVMAKEANTARIFSARVVVIRDHHHRQTGNESDEIQAHLFSGSTTNCRGPRMLGNNFLRINRAAQNDSQGSNFINLSRICSSSRSPNFVHCAIINVFWKEGQIVPRLSQDLASSPEALSPSKITTTARQVSQ